MIVWGESVSRLTTNEKRNFNDDKANTIGFKVDARFIARPRLLDDKFIDTSNMEAAKCLDDANKVFNDKTKLAIETKILLDNFVCNCNPTSIKKLRVLNIQIGGTEAEVCYMFLADSGLYIHNYAYNISLPSTLTLFADNCIDWFRRLVSFKKSCLHLAELSKAFTSNHSPTFENIFSRESSPSQLHTTCNSSWVRGTFFPPTKADPIPRFPKHFLSSPVLASKRKEVDGSDKADVKKRK
jgi:hypothetical protein